MSQPLEEKTARSTGNAPSSTLRAGKSTRLGPQPQRRPQTATPPHPTRAVPAPPTEQLSAPPGSTPRRFRLPGKRGRVHRQRRLVRQRPVRQGPVREGPVREGPVRRGGRDAGGVRHAYGALTRARRGGGRGEEPQQPVPQIDWSFPSSHATIAAVIVVAWRRWHRGGCRSGRTPVADTTARIAPTTRPTRSTATGALAQIRPPPAIRAVRLCRASTRPCRLEALTGQTPPWLLQIRLCGREGLVRCLSPPRRSRCSGRYPGGRHL